MNATAASLEITNLKLSELHPSPTNPRKVFEDAPLRELAESILSNGVLQPILVRKNNKGYEIIAGERRFRASKLAKREDIPSIIRKMTDAEVVEVQVIENLQREDLSAMEEAEGYRQLVALGVKVPDIAKRIGKSVGYVYAKAKLLDLTESVRKRFAAGKIDESTALLIARLPHKKLQEAAAKEVYEGMAYRQAKEMIERKFTTQLSKAPFDLKSVELVKAAGACTTCPKRTGNIEGFEGKGEDANVCTDALCYNEKIAAHWALEVQGAKDEGVVPLSEKEMRGLFDYSNGLAQGSGYVSLDTVVVADPKRRTVEALMGEDSPQVYMAKNAQGVVFRLVKSKEATAAVRKQGHAWAQPQAKKAYDPKNAKVQIEGTILAKTRLALIGEIGERAGRRALTNAAARNLALLLIETGYSAATKKVAARRELEASRKPKARESAHEIAIAEWIEKADAQECVGLITELIVAQYAETHYEFDKHPMVQNILHTYNVEASAVRAKVKDEVMAKVAEKEKALAATAKKAAAKKAVAKKAAAPAKKSKAA